MSLRDSAVKGAFWSSIGTVGAGLLNFCVTIFFARILSPADFGLIGFLLIFTILSESLVDSGFSQAVIKDNKATSVDLSSVFYMNIAIAITLYGILFFCSPLIANFYNEPELTNLSRFVFLTILFNAASIIQNANFSRNLNFKSQAIASISAIIIAATISIMLAINEWGVWAIASNMVLYSFLRMCFYWVLGKWRPVMQISFESIKKYFKFGSNLLIQGFVDKFVSNLESLLIGKIYTKVDLGYFSQARKLDSYIIQTSSTVIQRVTYPILAKSNDKDEQSLKAGYKRVLQMILFGMAPIMLFVIATADNVLYCLFGPQWNESTPYLRLWSICGLLQVIYSIFINIFLIKNRTRLLLKLSLLKQAFRLIIISSLIWISVISLMYGIVLVSVLSATIYIYNGGKLINYRFKEIFKDIYKTILSTLIAASIVYLIPHFIQIDNKYILLCLQLFVMIITHITLSKLLKNKAFEECRDIAKNIVKK